MTRKTIAADELIWLFREELRKLGHIQGGVSVAIMPDTLFGWTALTSAQDRKRHPQLYKRVERVQAKLREKYSLKRD